MLWDFLWKNEKKETKETRTKEAKNQKIKITKANPPKTGPPGRRKSGTIALENRRPSRGEEGANNPPQALGFPVYWIELR
jgi:hypothetical protein